MPRNRSQKVNLTQSGRTIQSRIQKIGNSKLISNAARRKPTTFRRLSMLSKPVKSSSCSVVIDLKHREYIAWMQIQNFQTLCKRTSFSNLTIDQLYLFYEVNFHFRDVR